MRRPILLVVLLATGLAACGAGNGSTDTIGNAITGGTPAPVVTAPAPAATTTQAATPKAVPAARGAGLAKVASFDSPVYVTAPPGDRSRVFVVSQKGQVWIVKDGRRLTTPFLDISSQVACCGEQGLLSIAFAPDYASSKRFYVDYTDRSGTTRVAEYRAPSATADRAITASRRLVISQPQPESNHNGGQLQFGPDRLLYVGLGDGGGADDQHGSRGNGQSLGTLLGKILRIDPRPSGGRPYSIPAGNPFRGRSGARPEIYAYGLRNPWRFSFDRTTGDLTIGDVGQNRFEEIDFARRGSGAGANYGWRPFEGFAVHTGGESAPGAVRPVLAYPHGDRGCSVTGGYVVRDASLPGLLGRYVYGDYCAGDLRAVTLAPGRATGDRSLGLQVEELASFGEDGRGRVYAVSNGGAVYRLVAR